MIKINLKKKNGSLLTCILLIFAILLSTVGQAGAVDLNGEIVEAGPDNLTWDATNWNFMFADINDYTSWTEKIYYEDTAGSSSPPLSAGNNTIDEGELIYSAKPYQVLFGLTLNENVVVGDNGMYAGFPFQQGYYVAANSDATTIAPLIFEYYWPEDVTTLAVGESFDLGSGYSIMCNQIDVEGDKVWLSLLKDGDELESDVIDTRTKNGSLFVAKDDVGDQEDVIYFTTYVDALFQGTSDSFVKLQYTWLVDKDEVRIITTDDTYGIFECTKAASDEIVFSNPNSISLKMDGATYLTDDMYLYTSVDNGFAGSNGGFNIYPGISTSMPGSYEVRGEIFEAGSDNLTWDATNWNFMFADINDYTSWTEKIYYEDTAGSSSPPLSAGNNTIDEGELIYSAKPYQVLFGLTLNEGVVVGDNGMYAGFPFQQGYYVAANSDATTIAPLIFEYYWPEDVTTLAVGESFDLGSGYSIMCNQIDVEGDKVWLSLLKEGEELESDVIDTRTKNGSLFVAKDDVGDQENVIYFTTYVDALFQGTSDSFVKLQYTWLIDKDEFRIITTDDTFGVFECTKAASDEIVFSNSNAISLKMDGATYLTDDIYLYTSVDKGFAGPNGGFNLYPALGVTIETEEVELVEEGVDTYEETDNITETINEASEDGAEINVSDSHEDSSSSTESLTTEDTPGFGIVLSILGLCMAIGYSRRR